MTLPSRVAVGVGRQPSRDSAVEQFVGRRQMVEDGDRHHGAQSARLENGIHGARNTHNHVVVEFILDDDIDELGTRRSRAIDH